MNTELTHAPRLAKKPITRSFHGDDVVDNYEWIRQDSEPAVLAHIEAENVWTELRTAHLASLRTQLVSEFAGHTKEDDVSVPVREGDYWYWSRTFEGKSYPAAYRCSALGTGSDAADIPDVYAGEAELLYDANVLAAGKDFFSIGISSVSPDGKLLALGIDNAGDELFDVRISQIDADETIDETLIGIGYGFVWSPDATRVYYVRNDDAWRSYQVWMHHVGQSAAEDVLLFEENDELFWVGIDVSRDGSWLVVQSESKLTAEVRLFATDDPHRNFIVSPRRAGLHYTVEPAGDCLLIIHNRENEDFDLALAPVGSSQPETWHMLYSAQPGQRLTEVVAFKDFAVLLMREGGAMQMRAFTRIESAQSESDKSASVTGTEQDNKSGGAVPENWANSVVIPTEELATLNFYGNEVWDAREVGFVIESVLTPDTFQRWSVDTGEVITVKRTEVPNYDATQFTQYRHWVTAQDGVRIPMTIVHRADLNKDGTNPGIIYGYGSYEISNDPWFSPTILSALERGVVYAIAHIRGGGEMGRAWYDNGKMLTKRNTFTDFVACARWMAESGLVDRQRLAAEGGSAGGLLMGAVTNLAPDAFRVVHAIVPFVDALNTILKPELPLTVGEWEEWGNPIESAEVYQYMKSYTPYENIAPVQYPAILASTSLNDVRVSYIEPTKWIQALRDTVTNDEIERPILQHTEMVAGHGGGSGRYKKWEERAAQLAFIFDNIGVR
ncbi:S9 family peptidase [Arcanobacterium pinnipediorum]|uniref:S9 family peptidase n=1 Tax=Arcanobacterium pinnipediorum TaxID=1503041 RepID=A0ABY5AHD2_9ACTO|nr:S9 family peptidase [Arcanobacterium pinnipediorum]USR79492.1 S9 family peptidase [Arcanobacterium pinnipediorum]